jgi:hypothetical protein
MWLIYWLFSPDVTLWVWPIGIGGGLTLALAPQIRNIRLAHIFFGFAWIWAFGCILEEIMKSRMSLKASIPLAFVVGGIIAVLALLSHYWVEQNHKDADAPKPSTASATEPKPKAPTLREMFTSDFPNTMKAADEEMEIKWKDGAAPTKVVRQVYLDFPAKARFVGFYIPFSPPHGFDACMALRLQVHKVMKVMEDKTRVSAGYRDESTDQRDLTFSGRVLLYYEDVLTIPQKASLIEAYKKEGFEVNFRGPDYLVDQQIAWYRQHDKKTN